MGGGQFSPDIRSLLYGMKGRMKNYMLLFEEYLYSSGLLHGFYSRTQEYIYPFAVTTSIYQTGEKTEHTAEPIHDLALSF